MAKTIQERIKDNAQYFKGMQVETIENEQIIYVVVQFPERWIIDETVQEKYDITVRGGTEYRGQWFFIAEMAVGFDAVFDAIEYNIEKMVSAEERANLLRGKILEMQQIFSDESIALESLRTLEFTWVGKEKNLPTATTAITEKKEETVIKRGRKPNNKEAGNKSIENE